MAPESDESAHVVPGTGWLRMPRTFDQDVSVKPEPYLPVYEELLSDLRNGPFALLELGVWKGDSLKMWRDCLPQATIVGVDLIVPDPPLELGPRVSVIQGSQSDAGLLTRVRNELAPNGFDVIIDDASHIGEHSAGSLQALYRQHLRPGGTYIIEDYGTGYFPDWPDGSRLAAPVGTAHLDRQGEPNSFPSHDGGLVGVVKSLVDHASAATIGMFQPDKIEDPLPIEWLRIQNGLAILRKPL